MHDALQKLGPYGTYSLVSHVVIYCAVFPELHYGVQPVVPIRGYKFDGYWMIQAEFPLSTLGLCPGWTGVSVLQLRKHDLQIKSVFTKIVVRSVMIWLKVFYIVIRKSTQIIQQKIEKVVFCHIRIPFVNLVELDEISWGQAITAYCCLSR